MSYNENGTQMTMPVMPAGMGGYGMGGFGGDGWWGILFIIAILCGGWGGFGGFGGWGGGNNAAFQGALTRADLCSEFNFNGLENSVRGVQQGLCDGFYAVNTSLLNGFHGIDNAVCTLGYQNAQLINGVNTTIMQGQNAIQTQLADCCCRTNNNIERGFADVGYRMATDTCAIQTSMASNTRDIIDSQNAGTRAILDWLCAKETADLRSENQNLKLAASQAAQNNYLVNTLRPIAQPAYITCNPYTGLYGGYQYGQGYGYNNGCGCNSGCCGCNG